MNTLLKTVLFPAVLGGLIIISWHPAWENILYDKRMTWFVEEQRRAQEILLIGMQRAPREYICGDYSSRGQATTENALADALNTLDTLFPKAVALAFRLPSCEAVRHLGSRLDRLRSRGIPLVLTPQKKKDVAQTLLFQNLHIEEDPNWYRIESGDTLSGLAYRFHTTVNTLKNLNDLSDDEIQKGERLLVCKKKSLSLCPTTSLTAVGRLEVETQDKDGILRNLDWSQSHIAPIGILLADLLTLKQTTPINSSSKIQSTVQKEQAWRIAYSESWDADSKPFHYHSLDDFSALDNQTKQAIINDKIVILFDATGEAKVRTPRSEEVPRAYIHAQVLLNRLTGMTIVKTTAWQTVCLILLGSIAMASLYHILSYRRRSNSNPIWIWLYPLGWAFFLFLIFSIGQYLALLRSQYMVEVIPPIVAIAIAALGVAILTWHQSYARLALRMEDLLSERDLMHDERVRLRETEEENTEAILKLDRQVIQKNAAILLLESDLKQQRDFQRQYLPHKVPLEPLKDEILVELQQEAEDLGIVTRDRAMLQAFRKLKQLSPIPEHPIFISGETGTGKELYAQASHRLSDRPHGPFETINMGELTGEKLIQRLFGTAKGAFTNVHGSEGLFQQTRNGTLFLDEIGNLGMEEQGKILRVVENKTFTPLGGKEIKTNVRLIFATNKSLPKLVQEGRFMEDLYYRIIEGGKINLIPLRHRDKKDLQLITQFLLESRCKNIGRNAVPQLTKEGLEWIAEQPWPGNVRELSGVLFRSLTDYPEVPTIRREHLVQALDTTLFRDEPGTPHSDQILSQEVTDTLTTRLSDEEFMRKFSDCQGAVGQVALELGQHRDRVTLRIKGLGLEAILGRGESRPNYEQCCNEMLRGCALSRHARRKLEKKLEGYWDALVKTCQASPSAGAAIDAIFRQNANMPTRAHYLRDLERFITQHYSSLSNQ